MSAVAVDLLTAIRRLGGDVMVIASDRLKVVAPRTLLPDFTEQVRALKPELLAALTAVAGHPKAVDQFQTSTAREAAWWLEQFTARTLEWYRGQRSWKEARRLAWGDLQNEWHERHGTRWPICQCAGCDRAIGGARALDLPDGNRVHDMPIDCLIDFGKRWRREADAALTSLGLNHND
jgi:hypothetical protein